MRNIFEEIGNIEINNRVFNKRVRVVKAEEEDPEPFTKEQMRILLDRCSNHNKLKYMVLKDSGIRVGELVQIKKRDINISKTPIEITISCYFENQCKPYCRPCAQRGILIPVYLLMFDEFRLKIWKNFHKFHV